MTSVQALNLATIDATDPTQADAYVGWWTRPGRVILGERLTPDLDALDSEVYTGACTEGALRILQTCAYDPGNQAYRFHSALNHATPHGSLFFRLGNQNPFIAARQLDMWRSRDVLAAAIGTADILHCHVDTWALGYTMMRWKQDAQIVIHYHGSVHPSDVGGPYGRLVDPDRDARFGAVQIGARLDHGEYGDLAWVPMTQPVRRLAALRQMYAPPRYDGRRPFRIAHSPTLKSIKGSDVFLAVCDRLTSKGLVVEPVLIEGHKHPDALAWKATCDATFDSFWLGLQGSGLEAGAMGMPVIAGDERTKRLHERHIGYCPYLYANDAKQLEDAIAGIMQQPTERDRWADRIKHYVWHWHTYERVAAMYLNAVALRTKTPRIREAIHRAVHTPPDGAVVPAMRPDDDLPWLSAAEDKPNKIVTPKGKPIERPKHAPIEVPKKKPRRYQQPAPMVVR